MLEDLDLNSIADDRARELVRQLLNLLEDVMADLRVAQAENQRLRDEINRLKGEQGRPTIKPNQPRPPSTDHSSEHERHKPKRWSKGRKIDRISIDREQVVQVDPDYLPPDAQFKGYEDVVVQDVAFRTDNVLFHKEKFYSLSQHQTYLASLPQGYNGQFGPGIKSLALVFYYGAQMSEPKVAELLRSVGVQISDGQVSNLLIKDQTAFHAEKDAVATARDPIGSKGLSLGYAATGNRNRLRQPPHCDPYSIGRTTTPQIPDTRHSGLAFPTRIPRPTNEARPLRTPTSSSVPC